MRPAVVRPGPGASRLAKTELDAAVRADPAQEPPHGLTQLLTGYRSTIPSPADETRLRLLSMRLIRSAIEATPDDDSSPLAQAASDAALAAAGLVDAERLGRTGATPRAIKTSIDAATQSLQAAITNLTPGQNRTNAKPLPDRMISSTPQVAAMACRPGNRSA